MYIDPNQQTNMAQEVNEATAKLKGLLGIGAGGGAPGGGEEGVTSLPTKQHQGEGGGKPPPGNKNKRNNRNKNKNSRQRAGRDNKEGGGHPQQQQQQPQQQHQNPQQNRGKSKSPHPQQQQQQQQHTEGNKKGKGKKHNKKSAKNKDSSSGGANSNNESKDTKNNFAWSAFQSSPDASTLPIPAFSPFTPKHEVAISTLDVEEHAEKALASLLPVNPTPPTSSSGAAQPELENVPKAEDLEHEVLAAAKKSNETQGAVEDRAKVEEEKEAVPPPSKTGINLAALTSGTSDHNPVNSTVSGSANPALSSVPTSQQQQQQQQQQQPSQTQLTPQSRATQHHHHQQQAPHMNYQFQHPHYHNPYHPMNHAYLPQPPPGYQTVTVQVPQMLLPGRQMIVHTPAGYPVQVVVPEGIPAGMFIPVHVPQMPLHMMAPQQQQQQQQAYQHQHRQHQQQAPQQQNRKGGT